MPLLSNRHSVTLSAMDEAIAKFVPAMPNCSPGVAPSGNGVPGRVSAPPSGATRAAGTAPAGMVRVLVIAVPPQGSRIELNTRL